MISEIMLYKVNENYINELKTIEEKVLDNYQEQRLYYKSKINLTLINGEKVHYLIPLSSAKESHKRIPDDNKTLFKIYRSVNNKDDFLGVLYLNNMIPVLESEMNLWIPDKKNHKYNQLIGKQVRYIEKNMDKLNEDIKILYNNKIGKLDPEVFKNNRQEYIFYKKMTSDVLRLEEASLHYSNNKKNI